jgi:hypothetical protein
MSAGRFTYMALPLAWPVLQRRRMLERATGESQRCSTTRCALPRPFSSRMISR